MKSLRSISVKYLFLAGIVFVLVFSFVFASFLLTNHLDNDARRINIAGRQRMLCFEIAWKLHQAAGVTGEERVDFLNYITTREMPEFDEVLRALRYGSRELELELPVDSEALAGLARITGQWNDKVKPVLLRAVAEIVAADQDGPLEFDRQNLPALKEFDRLIHDYVDEINSLVEHLVANYEQGLASFAEMRLSFIIAAILVSAGLGFWIRKKLVSPLLIMAEAAKEVANGDYGQRVLISNRDELGSLAADFNRMTVAIAAAFAENERLLQSSEQKNKEIARLASFPELNPFPVIECDRQGRLLYANPEAQRVFTEYGLEPTVFIPLDLIAGKTENDAPVGLDMSYKEVEIGAAIYGEYIHVQPDSASFRIYAYDITERKRSEEETQGNLARLAEYSEQLLALINASNSLVANRKTTNVYQDVCRIALETFGLRMAWLGIVEDDHPEVGVVASWGDEQGYLAGAVIRRDESGEELGPTGSAIKTGRPLIVNNIAESPFPAAWRNKAGSHGYRSFMAVPLVRGGKFVLGAINLYSSDSDFFTEKKSGIFQAYANQAVTAIENSLLVETLEKGIRERNLELAAVNIEYKKLINAVEQVAEAIIVTSPAGIIQYVNPAFCKTSGYSREEVLGKNPKILNSGKNPPGLFREMWRTILAGNDWHGLVINRKKNGGLYYEEMTVTPVLDDQNEIINFIAIKNDVTERVRNEQELRERNLELISAKEMAEAADRTKSEFLANMSHELRTPLNAVIGFSEMMIKGLAGALDEKQTEYLGHIYDSGTHLLEIINGILDLSRIEAGRLELELVEVDVKAVIDESLLFVREKALRHGLKISVETGDAVDHILADKLRIKQVLVNLLGNAVKFTPDDGAITVRAQMIAGPEDAAAGESGGERDFLEVRVEDTGPGIRPEDMAGLFTPFTQLESPYNKKHKGTGLGLAISKRIIDAHKGKIRVESEFGLGSSFVFLIPTRVSPDAEKTGSQKSS